MRRWGRPLACVAVIACGGAVAVACGSFGSNEVAPTPDAGAAIEEQESPITRFACGPTDCTAGEQACCQIGATFSCFGIDAGGCPFTASDAGGDAAPRPAGLLCTSYRNCGTSQQCCYEPNKGSSSCQNSCPNGSASLCTLNADRCGQNTDCQPLRNPPQQGIGECVSSGGGGTSGAWGGGSSGRW